MVMVPESREGRFLVVCFFFRGCKTYPVSFLTIVFHKSIIGSAVCGGLIIKVLSLVSETNPEKKSHVQINFFPCNKNFGNLKHHMKPSVWLI